MHYMSVCSYINVVVLESLFFCVTVDMFHSEQFDWQRPYQLCVYDGGGVSPCTCDSVGSHNYVQMSLTSEIIEGGAGKHTIELL